MNGSSNKIIIRTILISIVSIILINGINYISIKWIPVAHNSDWIPFYGSFVGAILCGIIGGLITLEGVKETINYAETTREEDERNKIKPYLQIEIIGLHGSEQGVVLDINNQGIQRKAKKNTIFSAKLKNIGLGAAINIRVKDKLIENSLQYDYSSKEFTIKTIFYNGEESINKVPIEVDFEDLNGNFYNQTYIIDFLGDVDTSKLKMIKNNTSPSYIETRK